MDTFFYIDWRAVFTPTINVAEIFLRGTVIYLFLFFVLRLLRRGAGALGISDFLVIVLIADAAQNAMASDYKSITEGLLLVGTIVFWDYLLDWLSYRFPRMHRVLRPKPLLLVEDGQLQRRNLKEEMITKEELMGQLREQGIEDIAEVRKCYLEADGQISVITDEAKNKRGKATNKLTQ